MNCCARNWALPVARDRVITVSPIEQAEFRKAGVARVDVLAHAVDVVRTDKPFRGRQDFLFVGRLEEDDSPNVDSVVWFITEVLPLIDQLMDAAPARVLGRTRQCSADKGTGKHAGHFGWRGRQRSALVRELPDFRGADAVRGGHSSQGLRGRRRRYSGGGHRSCLRAARLERPAGVQIGTSAEDFAEACVEVYTNETLWNAIRDAELELVEEVFSRAVFDRQLRLIFEAPDATPENGDFGSFNRLRGMRARSSPPERLRTPSDASVLEAPS